METTAELEAQYWWAFACLTLAGCRSAEQFSEETLKRLAGAPPSEPEVTSILDEAYQHITAILNSTLIPTKQNGRSNGNASYDIFKNSQNGDCIWVETVSGLEDAKKRLIALTLAAPGKYVLFNAREGGFVEPFTKAAGKEWAS